MHTGRRSLPQGVRALRAGARQIAVAAAGSALAFGAMGFLGAAAPASGTVNGPAQVVGAVSGAHLAQTSFGTAEQSNNWSGYQLASLVPGTYHQISASWVVPTASQAVPGQSEASATWIGIGGGCVQSVNLIVASTCVVDQTLIQAGSEQDVSASGKTVTYGVWYEILPEPETPVSLPVTAGDTVSVDIAEGLPASWTITITVTSPSSTTTVTHTATIPTNYPGLGLTAEWIEESPLLIGTGGTGISSLPELNSGNPAVTFSQARLNGAKKALASATPIQLISGGGRVLLSPSAPDPDADAFAVCENLKNTSHTTLSCSAPSASADGA